MHALFSGKASEKYFLDFAFVFRIHHRSRSTIHCQVFPSYFNALLIDGEKQFPDIFTQSAQTSTKSFDFFCVFDE